VLGGPLSSRNFRLLSACSVISVGGSQIATVAVPFAVLRSGGTASDVGYVAAAEPIAMIGSLLVGGAIADRAPRHRVMMAAESLQAVAQAIAAVLLLTGQARVWQLAILAAAGGVGFGFYYPAAQGLLPQTVQASQLARANALFRTGRNAASIGGAALGGILTGLAGPWRPTRPRSPPPPCGRACGSTACRPRRQRAPSVTCVTAGASSRPAAGYGRWWRSSRS
jgi:MFS family permease